MDDKEQEDILNTLRPSKGELDQADKEIGIVTMVNGTMESGEDFYAYMSVYPSRLEAFIKAQEEGGYLLTDFGDILMQGFGKIPPPGIVRLVEERYGVVADPEQDFMELLQQEFIKVLEEEEKKSKMEKDVVDPEED